MTQLNTRVTEDLKAQVTERAKARGMSINDWVNAALRFALSGKHAVEVVETATTKSRKIEL